jgi:vacuolar-type H+-ATPase subunit F/Vma7
MFQTVAAIGEQALLDGYRLVGVIVLSGSTPEEILAAWTALPRETAMVILTPRSAQALEPVLADPHAPLTVVLPQ